jgi:hypothetical protein
VDESGRLLSGYRSKNSYPGFESRSLRLLPTVAAVALFCCMAAGSRAFSQNPTEQYLVQRRAAGWLRGASIEAVARDPAAFKDRVFEIEGRLTGLARGDDGDALLILSETPLGSLPLSMTLTPSWLQPGARVRVLCSLVPPEDGEVVVGMPGLAVVAVASASDIASAEARLAPRPVGRVTPSATPVRPKTANRGTGGSVSRAAATRTTAMKGALVGPKARAYPDLSPSALSVFPHYRAYIQKHNRKLSLAQADAITYAILRFSEEYDLDPRLMVATIIAESDFRIATTSHKGAMGLIQLMPDEVRRLRLTNPYDPVQNIAGGVFLIKERLNRYSRSPQFKDATAEHIVLALASYNAGMGAVRRYGGVPPYRETQGYVRRIMRIYRELCAGDSG